MDGMSHVIQRLRIAIRASDRYRRTGILLEPPSFTKPWSEMLDELGGEEKLRQFSPSRFFSTLLRVPSARDKWRKAVGEFTKAVL